MIDIFGEIYYIDFDVIDKFLGWDPKLKAGQIIDTRTIVLKNEDGKIISTEITETKTDKPKEINGVRWELIRDFIGDLGDITTDEVDDSIGGDKPSHTSLGFRLAFNTLRAYGILKPLAD